MFPLAVVAALLADPLKDDTRTRLSREVEAHLVDRNGGDNRLDPHSATFRYVAAGGSDDGRCHATAPRPFFATSVRSFNDAPRGRFSPRSHWLTSPVVTLRWRANTA